jgi:hypothetical protein
MLHLFLLVTLASTLVACSSARAVRTVSEVRAPLRAYPGVSASGPDVGTKEFDFALVNVTNRASYTARIVHASVAKRGDIEVMAVLLVPPKAGSSSPQEGIEPTPLRTFGRPVRTRPIPASIGAGGQDVILVRARLSDRSGLGYIDAVVLTYEIAGAMYRTEYRMPLILCGAPRQNAKCIGWMRKMDKLSGAYR